VAELCDERAKKLAVDYDRQPCGRRHGIKLEKLSYNIAQFSMDVIFDDCVIDLDETCMVQGGVIPILVDFAGVYLARMNTQSEYITPLARLEEDYRDKIIFGKDRRIIARASIHSIEGRKIRVNVAIENEKGESKGKASLLFVERRKNF